MMKTKKASIGVFDSGFGGLTILRGIVKALPEYDYIYLGDNARVPYGSRSPDVVYAFTLQAVEFLFGQGCDLVILACNTASADALRRIQKEYLSKGHPNKRVLGVLIPAAEEAAAVTKNGRVGVIATEGTVASGAFPREIGKIERSVLVFQNACPLLVPIIESGEHDSVVVDIMLEKYLAPLNKRTVDTLILGCTHYGILEKKIRKSIGAKVSIVSEAHVVPKKLKAYLKRHPEIERKLGRKKKRLFYSTDPTDKFNRFGSRFFGAPIRAKKAILE